MFLCVSVVGQHNVIRKHLEEINSQERGKVFIAVSKFLPYGTGSVASASMATILGMVTKSKRVNCHDLGLF